MLQGLLQVPHNKSTIYAIIIIIIEHGHDDKGFEQQTSKGIFFSQTDMGNNSNDNNVFVVFFI